MYAKLCVQLVNSLKGDEQHSKDFRACLLRTCQQEFEKGKNVDQITCSEMSKEDQEVALFKLRFRKMGLVKFIGELFNVGLLNAKAIHDCVEQSRDNLQTPYDHRRGV